MRVGNVSQTVWKRSVLKQLHREPAASLLRISMAEMCTALPINENKNTVFVTAEVSVSGNSVSIGYYALVKALNDLMTRGGEPSAVQVYITLPTSAKEKDVQALVKEMKELCELHCVSIAGIRVEVNAALVQKMVHVTAMGMGDQETLLAPENGRSGQDIILCGSVALEGMERILDECEAELRARFAPAFLRQMKALRGELLQDKAIQAAKGYADVMQQIGSGGIFATLWEVAEAAKVGLQVDLKKMTVCQETVEVCEFYRLNPYQMTSAGGILMLTEDGDTLLERLRSCGARAVRIGYTTAENARVITSGEEIRFLDRPAPDELSLWQEQRLWKAGNYSNEKETEHE